MTGVQTCALPIWSSCTPCNRAWLHAFHVDDASAADTGCALAAYGRRTWDVVAVAGGCAKCGASGADQKAVAILGADSRFAIEVVH